VRLRTDVANAAARDWAIATNYDALGMLSFQTGAAVGNTPLTSVARLTATGVLQIDHLAELTAAHTITFDNDVTLSARSIITDTTTGLKIGTGITQKLGFFNHAPVVQQTFTAVSNPPTQAQVTAIRDAIINLGLMAAS